jgi:hypothetical protein
MRKPTAVLVLIISTLVSGCGYISFARPVTQDETIVQEEIKGFYNKVQEAFATGNPDALTSLFSPSITHPMTHDQIAAWAQKFFADNKNGHFRILKFSIDGFSYINATVTLTYKVETPGQTGDFGATERNTLVKDHGQWYIMSWDKVDPNEKNGFDTIFSHP